MFSSTQKENVEIIAGNTRKKLKKYKIIEGNKLEIKKGKKGRGKVGYSPSFNPQTSFLYYRSKFGFLKRKLVLTSGAVKCWEFKDQQILEELPTREGIKSYFEAKLLTHAGQSVQKVQVPILLYLLVGGVLLLQVFMFLQFMGFVR